MKGALDVHGALLAADVAHEVVRLRTPVTGADDLPAAVGVDACGAVRCYVVDGRLVAVLVRAGCVPDPSALLDALHARSTRAATTTEVNAGTDYDARLVSPVCLPPEVELLVDAALLSEDVLYVPAGEGRVALGIRARDLVAATGARPVPLLSRPHAPAAPPGWSGGTVIDLRRPARRPAR